MPWLPLQPLRAICPFLPVMSGPSTTESTGPMEKQQVKLTLDLTSASSPEWLAAVMNDFDAFLQDHANCERKASAMAMSFVAKCPDRVEIIPELIETAIEELQHFQMVYELMQARGIQLPEKMGQDHYVEGLIKLCRSNREERLLDRFIIASVVETRGAERFRLVSEALEDEELKLFYKKLWISEAKHGHIFAKMALEYFPEDEVYARMGFFIEQESALLATLEPKAALH